MYTETSSYAKLLLPKATPHANDSCEHAAIYRAHLSVQEQTASVSVCSLLQIFGTLELCFKLIHESA